MLESNDVIQLIQFWNSSMVLIMHLVHSSFLNLLNFAIE